jgi:hypothetical protein
VFKFLVKFVSNVVIAIILAIIFVLFYVSDSLKKHKHSKECFIDKTNK